MNENIYLIGMPGAGKTTLGQALARRLSLPFEDLDKTIEAVIGCSISSFFSTRGEAAFRDVERQMLQEASLQDGRVVATGGGIVLRPENVQCMRDTGRVFWIRRSIEDILGDIETAHRPLLANRPAAERLRELEEKRQALYLASAHHIIDNGRTLDDALAAMLASLPPL